MTTRGEMKIAFRLSYKIFIICKIDIYRCQLNFSYPKIRSVRDPGAF